MIIVFFWLVVSIVNCFIWHNKVYAVLSVLAYCISFLWMGMSTKESEFKEFDKIVSAVVLALTIAICYAQFINLGMFLKIVSGNPYFFIPFFALGFVLYGCGKMLIKSFPELEKYTYFLEEKLEK